MLIPRHRGEETVQNDSRMGYNKIVERSLMTTPASRETHFEGVHCALTIQAFPRGVVLVKISGTDTGEFGDAPLLELQQCLTGLDPIHLFIDARDVRGASIEVSGEWAEWLRDHQAQLRCIGMLTGSRFVEVTAGFVRRFAALQGTMRVYTEPAAFDAALTESLS
jgi:hypothetical protein